ncbi:ScbR family autoregulator-binding transcription factor [Streptomyces tailanensis]|uniref:ScbR family autoregulator-binding transcription factor n=1 Tax=Streptomyces tailanensis TaxID=2569858 RepID=UPI00122E1BAD|nr:ScbR family autoregulator-binding transcription factor [Streptomyces tailanensis]
MAKQERAVRTRNALIESAAELFDRDGFETASLSMISARAGVSSGALHFHFASKADLADAVGHAAALRLDRITAREADDTLQSLIDATYALVAALGRDAVLRAGFGLSDGVGRERAGAGVRQVWQEWVEGVLVRAAAEGALARGVSAEDAAAVVVAATAGLESLGRHDPRWFSPDSLTRFWRLLLPRLARTSNLRASAPSVAPGSLAASGARRLNRRY